MAFLWHGFGDSAANFTGSMNAGSMSAGQNLIVVAPDPLYDPGFGMPKTWHIMGNPAPDLGLFDDEETAARAYQAARAARMNTSSDRVMSEFIVHPSLAVPGKSNRHKTWVWQAVSVQVKHFVATAMTDRIGGAPAFLSRMTVATGS